MRLSVVLCLLAILASCTSDPSRTDDGSTGTATCGNGKLDDGEKCDPGISSGPGVCPTSCDDANPCTDDSLRGSPDACSATCTHEDVTSCATGDGCCPAGCNDATDNDCTGCHDECPTAGNLRCDGTAVSQCGNFDGDSCLEWGPATACAAGEACNAGKCEKSCVSDCTTVGATRCDETGAVVTCANSDGKGCLKWGAATHCEAPQVCANGECAASCTDECPHAGDKRCVAGATAQFETCGNFDADGCLEWGNAQNCGANLVCSGGACVSSCSNSCPSDGAVTCQGNATVTCGDFNHDGCLEWGTAANCGSAQQCANGACGAIPMPGKVLINEVVYDTTGSPDYDAFVELYGPPGISLAGFKLVGVNGNGGGAYNTITLVGNIGADGFFVIAHPNGSASLKAVADQLDSKVDYQNGPDSIQLQWGSTVVDALGYGTFGTSDVFAGEAHAVKGTTAAGHGLGRNGAHADTDDNSLDFKEFAAPSPGADNEAVSTCGNGVVDAGETCDGNCPTSCADQDACTTDAMTGSAATCSAACTHVAITQCVGGDGCCAPGCTSSNDSDCTPPATTDDPFDPASCSGAPMSDTLAHAKLGTGVRVILGNATIRSRTRTCTSGQPCGTWSAATDYTRTLVTYSGGVTTRQKTFTFATDLIVATTLPGGLGFSVREVGDVGNDATADAHGLVWPASPMPATTTNSTVYLWDPNPQTQYDYPDFSVPLGTSSLQLFVGESCARWSGITTDGTQELAALYRF